MKTILRCSALILAMALLAACSSAQQDPSEAFCGALTELNDTGATIAALGEVADSAQIVQLGSAMDNNWQNLASAAEDMDAAVQTAFAPYDEQYTAIPAITQETALPVARESLDTKNEIATGAYDELYPGSCQ